MRTTFDLTTAMREAFEQAREREGYGARRKSQWINEAIRQLPLADPTFSSVGLGEGLMKFDTKMIVTLAPESIETIRQAKAMIRRADPEAEGLSGAVIRAAIRHRVSQSGHRTQAR